VPPKMRKSLRFLRCPLYPHQVQTSRQQTSIDEIYHQPSFQERVAFERSQACSKVDAKGGLQGIRGAGRL